MKSSTTERLEMALAMSKIMASPKANSWYNKKSTKPSDKAKRAATAKRRKKNKTASKSRRRK